MPTEHFVYQYFGSIPLTLKNIVIRNGAKPNSRYAFQNITGVNIYVEAEKADVQHWDDMYPGWNNGNKVYYGGEWISAEFYGTDGELIDSSIYLTSQVVQQPYYVVQGNEQYSYVIGWDLDGDGFADSVPATSNKNIVAHAVATQVLNQYSVKYYGLDGKTVLYAYILNYGDSVPIPAEAPEKHGYTFLGWDGYVEGMSATENISIYSRWEHSLL